MRLDGKVALITGAGSGIGRQAALRFSQEGAKIVVVDLNLTAAEETVAFVKEQGGEAIATRADVSKAADSAAMVALA